jgi:hypothetical protein
LRQLAGADGPGAYQHHATPAQVEENWQQFTHKSKKAREAVCHPGRSVQDLESIDASTVTIDLYGWRGGVVRHTTTTSADLLHHSV